MTINPAHRKAFSVSKNLDKTMAKEKNSENKNVTNQNDCFIIMPISEPEGYEKGHFNKVYEDIIKVACKSAGFSPIRADEVKQTNLIHLDILQKLIDSPMAICDLSNRNPNVLFELGLRQAFDKPTVLIQECGTPKIFDISPLRYTEYRKELKYREVLEDQELIANAIKATKEATEKGEGINSIVSLLSLSSPATLKEISDNDTTKMMQIIMSEMNDLRTDFRQTLRRFDDRKSIEERNLIVNNRELYTYDKQIDEIKLLLSRLEKAISENAPIEVAKMYYDRIQIAIKNISNYRLPLRYSSLIQSIQDNSELLIAKASSNKE